MFHPTTYREGTQKCIRQENNSISLFQMVHCKSPIGETQASNEQFQWDRSEKTNLWSKESEEQRASGRRG